MVGRTRKKDFLQIIKKLVIQACYCSLALFYDKQYLVGKNYEKSFAGWLWIFRTFWHQKVLGYNKHVPWPISPASAVDEPHNVFFDPDDAIFFMHFGCYFSNSHGGKIFIGKGTFIAPNVGIVTTNHDPRNVTKHLEPRDVHIGTQCWIGMNAVILPGVKLGANTIVAAGAVVTKSFEQGNCIIAGNPAVLKKML